MVSTPSGITCASITGLGLETTISTARTAEKAGFNSFWAAELTGPEAFSLLSAVGAVTTTLDLGTGVVPIQVRTPETVAMAAATLQALSPERTIRVGIGVSSPVIVERWYGQDYSDRPLAQLREYVALLKACWTGETVNFDGEFYQTRGFRLGVRLGDRKPEIILGALNPGMLKLAGEIADGVLLNYVPSSHVAWSVDQVRRGGDATVYAYVHLGVGKRDEVSRRLARRDLYVYASAPAHRANFIRAGYESEMAEFAKARSDHDRDSALAAISESMIDGINLMGDASTVRAQWQSYIDAGVQHPILMPLPWGDDRAAVINDTIEALA